MATIIRGDDSPQLQRQTYSYDVQRGGTYAEEWKGFNPAKMITKYNGEVYTSQRAQLTIAQAVAELRIEWGGSPSSGGRGGASSIEVTIDRWDVSEPTLDKPLLSHPKMSQVIYSIASYQDTGPTYPTIIFLTSLIAKGIQANASMYNWMDSQVPHWTTFTSGQPDLLNTFLQFCRLMLTGQDRYESSSYAVRHTTNAPSYWSLNRADVNINSIYPQAMFLSEVTDPTLWYYPMPGRLQFKLASAVSALFSITPAMDSFQIGWLKSPSSETSVARGRIEINTSYSLDQWSTDVYPVAT